MKRLVASVLMALALVPMAFAIGLGDEAVFEVTTQPQQCTEVECDLDVSDGSGTFIYGSWALKDPDGVVRASQEPELACGTDYVAQTTFFNVDKAGTWILCTTIDAYGMFEQGNQCVGAYYDCSHLTECQEIQVVEACNIEPFELGISNRYEEWIGTW